MEITDQVNLSKILDMRYTMVARKTYLYVSNLCIDVELDGMEEFNKDFNLRFNELRNEATFSEEEKLSRTFNLPISTKEIQKRFYMKHIDLKNNPNGSFRRAKIKLIDEETNHKLIILP